MDRNNLDFLIIAPTPFFANRGCHLRIRGEAEALRKKGSRLKIITFKEGKDVGGLVIKRSSLGVGRYGRGVAASWHNFPNGFFLFWNVLHETIYRRPRVIYGHLFEGAAIGIVVKYLAFALSLFSYNPLLVLDAQGSLRDEMREYGMLKNAFLLGGVGLIERLILFFPDYVFTSSLRYQKRLKKLIRRQNIYHLPDGISFFEKNILRQKTSRLSGINEKKAALLKIADSFTKEQSRLLRNWIGTRKKIILYAGSYAEAKGLPAFAREVLPRLIKNNHLRLLFGGGDFAAIPASRKIFREGRDKIISLGNLDEKNLPYFLTLGDIALDLKPTNTSESSGKILNYMAIGLPVICYHNLNNRFFLRDGGFYARDERELERQIIFLAGNPKLRKKSGRKNLARAWQELTWDKTAEKIIKLVSSNL